MSRKWRPDWYWDWKADYDRHWGLYILDRTPEASTLFHLLPEELRMGSFVDQYGDKPNGKVMEVVAVDEAFKKRYPAVYDFVVTGVAHGKPRKTSTVTLFAENGFFKLCLNDRQRSVTLWRTGEAVLEAAMALEKALQDGSADWRPNSQGSYTPRKA